MVPSLEFLFPLKNKVTFGVRGNKVDNDLCVFMLTTYSVSAKKMNFYPKQGGKNNQG